MEKKEFSDGAYSGGNSYHQSMDIDSPDYEYSNYDSNNDQNAILQMKYNKILAKRFPNLQNNDTASHHTPNRNILSKRSRKKYNFHIPAHLKSKSKEFLSSHNIDGSKYNLEILSNGKYSVNENQSYSKMTKRRFPYGMNPKLSPPNGRIMNPRHALEAQKERFRQDNYNFDNRSGSLPDISRDSRESTNDVSKSNSKSRLSKMYKIVNKQFRSKKNMNRHHKSGDESSYGKSTRNSYSKQQNLNSRQILERLQKKKHHNSFGPAK